MATSALWLILRFISPGSVAAHSKGTQPGGRAHNTMLPDHCALCTDTSSLMHRSPRPRHTNVRERKMRTNFFCTNLLNTPSGPGNLGKIPRDIPDSSLRKPRKTIFRGRARTFWPPPLCVEDPTPPAVCRTQKVNLCALFSCLKCRQAWSKSVFEESVWPSHSRTA